jgi:hypothetical protein
MYKVYAGPNLVGFSALEAGDAPMGVAFGNFQPTAEYDRIRDVCQKNHSDQSDIQLSVTTADGAVIPAIGVSILDYSISLGEPEIEINLLGVEAKLYESLFPRHVQSYKQL